MDILRLARHIIKEGFDSEIELPYIMTFENPVLAARAVGYTAKAMPFGISGVANDWNGFHIIGINIADDWHNIVDTVAHELVHIWQYENTLPVNHGKIFQNKLENVLHYIDY